jgi:hypothetical protein
MELLTFSLILYQSKNCGHRIHVLCMMYDVYWYCQMKKKRMFMKILKNEWFIWKFWKKGGVVEKRGEEETKSMPHAPCACAYGYRFKINIQKNVWYTEQFVSIVCSIINTVTDLTPLCIEIFFLYIFNEFTYWPFIKTWYILLDSI